MNSGRFERLNGRIRPGTYINVDSANKSTVSYADRGNVLIPLVNTWGPNAKLIKIESSDITSADTLLGSSVDNILLLSEAFKGAGTVLAYNMNTGEAAKAVKDSLTVTALYPGTRGNDIKVACSSNVDGGYDITVILGTSAVEEFTGIADISAASGINSGYVKFSGEGDLSDFAGLSLTGGRNNEITKADVTDMLDAVENENISAIAFPFEDNELKAAACSKAEYLRDNCGRSVQVVVADYPAADYEGVINVTNSYALTDGTELTTAQATAYVAAVTASATELVSNTYRAVTGADTVVGRKSNEEAEASIQKGEFFFTQQGDEVIIEYDINSLHTFTEKRSESYRKNKILRVYDAVSDTLRETFPPNKFPNSSIGWDLMDGLCQTILQYFLDEGAIKNVDIANDMKVNRSESTGDSVYFDASIHAVDAAEKLYFAVITD
jgi:hypothetical protein